MSAARLGAPVSSGATANSEFHPKIHALSLIQVVALTNLSKAHIYALIARGEFPQPAKIGRKSIWDACEIERWLEALFAERGRP